MLPMFENGIPVIALMYSYVGDCTKLNINFYYDMTAYLNVLVGASTMVSIVLGLLQSKRLMIRL